MPYSSELAHLDIAGRADERNSSENTKVEIERYYLRELVLSYTKLSGRMMMQTDSLL